jgi:DNA-binding Lrp family transcriptional regulator
VAPRKGAAPASDSTLSEGRKDTLGKRPSSLKQSKNPQPKSWRDVLDIHPAADLFPLMSKAELRELGEDIKRHGLRSRIVLWSPSLDFTGTALLDGRNRLDAMEMVGLSLVEGSELSKDIGSFRMTGANGSCDPYEFVLSANIHRRHLMPEDKRDLIAKLIKAAPEKSNRQIAEAVKVSHPHVGKIRSEMERAGDVETASTSIDTKGRKQPAKKKRRTEDDFKRDLAAKKKREPETARKDDKPEPTASPAAVPDDNAGNAAFIAARALHFLDRLIDIVEKHPGLDIGLAHFGERLMAKASAIVEIAQRKRGAP